MKYKINNIYTENCLDAFKHMPDNCVDHVFTSPPYNRKRNDKYNFYEDKLVDYKTFLKEVIDESLRVSKDYVFFNIQKNYYNKKEVFELIGLYSLQLIDILIWNKSNPMPASGFNITNSYEFILVLSNSKKSLKSNKTYTKNSFTTTVNSNNKFKKIHRAVMHPETANYVIQNFTLEHQLILDPFAGVGTIPKSCKDFDRNYIGFDISKIYTDISKQVLMQT